MEDQGKLAARKAVGLEDGYDEYLAGVAKTKFTDCKTREDLDSAMTDILGHFRGDFNKFSQFLGAFLQNNEKKYSPAEKKEVSKVSIEITNEDGKKTDIANGKDLFRMQRMRRRSSFLNTRAMMDSDQGRRLSNIQKKETVIDAAIRLAYQEDDEERAMFEEKDDDIQEEEEESNFEFLPYTPIPGDPIDEALAEQLNIFEIDINIRRISGAKIVVPIQPGKKGKRGKGKKKKKVKKKKRSQNLAHYMVRKKKYTVKLIHGVLLFKIKVKGKTMEDWQELVPKLKKLKAKVDKEREKAEKGKGLD